MRSGERVNSLVGLKPGWGLGSRVRPSTVRHTVILANTIYNVILSAGMPLPKAYPLKVETVGDHIRAVRLRRGLEQSEVAEILGVSKETVWNWENHRNAPLVHQCRRSSHSSATIHIRNLLR
ncbi:helix-turn-helix domain-containing protein [Luteolibacter yonseiensis]|uniref:helix-turn-helix domain-containing protein n=2 Tax=Luteolibacter yonseiensis TaxID=1144680 RepID=UPI003CE4A16E